MDYTYMMSFVPIIVLMIIIFINQRNEKTLLKNILKKRKSEDNIMYELAQKFLGKECIIYTFNSQLSGTIKEVNESGILVEKSGSLEVINIDFVVRIREYPLNKNGKKKSVILD